MARTRIIKFRVSDAEYASLSAKGEAAGSMSALLRDHLGAVTIRHREDERKRIAMLNRINSNLNQIAKWANSYKDAASSVQVIAHLAAVEREIAALVETSDEP